MVTMIQDEEGDEVYECSICHRRFDIYGSALECEKNDEDIGGV